MKVFLEKGDSIVVYLGNEAGSWIQLSTDPGGEVRLRSDLADAEGKQLRLVWAPGEKPTDWKSYLLECVEESAHRHQSNIPGVRKFLDTYANFFEEPTPIMDQINEVLREAGFLQDRKEE